VAFPPERRGTAIGLFSAVTGIAVASGAGSFLPARKQNGALEIGARPAFEAES
jgi:hypothetical protein